MFAEEIRSLSRYGRLCRRRSAEGKTETAVNQILPGGGLADCLHAAMTEMLPSTAEEIADTLGADTAAVGRCLDEMACRCRVMFNPLTKRYSLPRPARNEALAA